MASSFFSALPSLLSITDEQAMWRVKMQDDPQAFAKFQQAQGELSSALSRLRTSMRLIA